MTALRSLRSKEVAELLDVSDETVRRWRTTGHGPPWYKSGGSVRYRPEALEAWKEAREQAQDL